MGTAASTGKSRSHPSGDEHQLTSAVIVSPIGAGSRDLTCRKTSA
jgi:hypothetical protein